MKTPSAAGIDRRAFLGAGALAAMMLQPGWLAAARAQAPALAADPRFAFIDRVAELTIPTTDTPGASDAGAPAFVLLALDERMNGLDPAMASALQTRLDADAGGGFLRAEPAEQLRLLTALDAAAYADAMPALGTPEMAWRRIKAAIVAGYYASEVGASTELIYEPLPAQFQNITLDADFRQRSNDGFGGVW